MKFMISKITKTIFFLLLIQTDFTYAENIEATFLFVGDKSSQAYFGANQGLVEANLQGEFLGQKYTLTNTTIDNIDSNLDSSVAAILVSDTKENFLIISKNHSNLPVFNLSLEDDDLRQVCSTNQFHTIPSHRMKDDALNQWQQKEPDSKAISQTWHPSFKKFAARDLNKRFFKTNNEKMLDEGWAGWAAVKMVSDTVARENKVDQKRIIDFLKNELDFDGQKGISMSFRDNGQLRQPILIVEGDKIHAEAPIRGVANPPTLDSLGNTDSVCE